MHKVEKKARRLEDVKGWPEKVMKNSRRGKVAVVLR